MHIRYLGEDLKYQTKNSACFDISSMERVILHPGQRALISTGLYLEGEADTEHYLQILSRSGLSVKYGVVTLAGVIDSDYRDEIKVVLLNAGQYTYTVAAGERIAQAAWIRVDKFPGIEVKEDVRIGGFGSTGV